MDGQMDGWTEYLKEMRGRLKRSDIHIIFRKALGNPIQLILVIQTLFRSYVERFILIPYTNPDIQRICYKNKKKHGLLSSSSLSSSSQIYNLHFRQILHDNDVMILDWTGGPLQSVLPLFNGQVAITAMSYFLIGLCFSRLTS